MTTALLPTPAQAVALAVDPSSITWRRAGDARTMLGAGAALMLQVGHPTVAAGVREHSNFERDPWGRLLRTLDFVNLLVYGGPERARLTGCAIRRMHQQIKGVAPDGRRYHALEPEAYAWVHGTLAEVIVAAHARFGRPMRPDQLDRFWVEWKGLGRMLGVRDRDLPDDWDAFGRWVDEIIATRLEDSDVVRSVLRSLGATTPPAGVGERAWGALRLPTARALRLGTVGLLRPAARERLNLPWSRAQEIELELVGRLARSTTPVLPSWLRTMGPRYLRWREDDLHRGRYAHAAAA